MYTHSPRLLSATASIYPGPSQTQQISRAMEVSIPRKGPDPELITYLLVCWATILFEEYQLFALLISAEAELI